MVPSVAYINFMVSFKNYGLKDTNKRARNMKLASIFFTASAGYFRGLPQRYKQTSEKYEACFNIFHSECRLFSRLTSKIQKKYFEVNLKDTKKIYSIKRTIISKSYSKVAQTGLKCAIDCVLMSNISNFVAEN